VPQIVRYFHAEKGVMVKVLELVNLGSETSDLLLSYVLEVLQKLYLLEKVIAIIQTLVVRRGKGRIICTTNWKKNHQTT
jgi:hypothetical protein